MRQSVDVLARWLFEMIDMNHFALVMRALAALCDRQMYESRARGDEKAESFWGYQAKLMEATGRFYSESFDKFHEHISAIDKIRNE